MRLAQDPRGWTPVQILVNSLDPMSSLDGRWLDSLFGEDAFEFLFQVYLLGRADWELVEEGPYPTDKQLALARLRHRLAYYEGESQ